MRILSAPEQREDSPSHNVVGSRLGFPRCASQAGRPPPQVALYLFMYNSHYWQFCQVSEEAMRLGLSLNRSATLTSAEPLKLKLSNLECFTLGKVADSVWE